MDLPKAPSLRLIKLWVMVIISCFLPGNKAYILISGLRSYDNEEQDSLGGLANGLTELARRCYKGDSIK